ncbi:DUF4249 domain-containing protein [Spongiivirga citrea]|uniref:DUF4249 family protein n=1 Tax=Spongiivirga citrea TaxID=1481457 RepID=A0A6M0CEV9_9FLAO|nr:DUF4249 domain-containing protein [Spongiivirga citrea]NER16368.1 DUF4249 family protein [Spongiivirga citrea]
MKKVTYMNLIAPLLVLSSCIETFEPGTQTFEDTLIIEGRITNELKEQVIFITRSFRFEDEGPSQETGATVRVVGDTGMTINFIEASPGKYISETPFSAQSGIGYHLEVISKSGQHFQSTQTNLPPVVPIAKMYHEAGFDSNNSPGIGVYVDSENPQGNANFYRYEFIETYRIEAPKWSPLEAIVISDVWEFEVDTAPREQEERVCYKTNHSTAIMQATTNASTEDKIQKFPVRFIVKDDYMTTHRYSILVKQYVQTREAYRYFEKLNEFSQSENLFSDIQPGFLEGNIRSLDDADKNAVGFFEVTSVTSKRLYFKYHDAFPGERLPKFVTNCTEVAPPLASGHAPEAVTSPLIDNIKLGLLRYFDVNNRITLDFRGPFIMVPPACGDCTVLGSNIKPDFWEDE